MPFLTPEEELIDEIAKFHYYPEKHAKFAYDWGEGELEGDKLRKWQLETLELIGKELRRKKDRKNKVIRIAIASGHDIGKTAFTAMVQKWAMDTQEDCRIQCTANTGNQLRTKTWAELAKWHRLSITAGWFYTTATSFYSSQENHNATWRSDAVVWREGHAEAFAGLHNRKKRIVLILDEASAIPDPIWDNIDGMCTDEDTEIIVLAFGNPTRNSGRFHDIFHGKMSRATIKTEGGVEPMWLTRHIDSRDVEGTNKEEMEAQIKIHGVDSDWVRTRIRGLFPRASSMQFIPNELVGAAFARVGQGMDNDPLICGLDFALGGDDRIVFFFRRGLDAQSIAPIIIPGEHIHNAEKLVSQAIEIFNRLKPDYIFADEGAMGKPIIDRLEALGFNIHGVGFGKTAPDDAYADMTAYMGAKAKKWLEKGALWENEGLEQELTQREYDYMPDGSTIYLESKKELKKRLALSPDIADAFFLTFAIPVQTLHTHVTTKRNEIKNTSQGYSPLHKRINKARNRMNGQVLPFNLTTAKAA